jgi:hypothetical protein
MLSEDGMAECRARVLIHYEWFTHGRTIDQFDSVRANGILPSQPDTVCVPTEVIEARGESGRQIICLSIHPKTRPMHLNKNGARAFKVALHDLPKAIGLDWSFGGTFDDAQNMRECEPSRPIADIFLAIVKDREVVVTYEPIPASALRVCTKATINKPPSEWPPLVETDFDEVAQFEPDFVGNIAL